MILRSSVGKRKDATLLGSCQHRPLRAKMRTSRRPGQPLLAGKALKAAKENSRA
jgi:hypothetical protein